MITLKNVNTKCKDFLSRGQTSVLLDITERDFEIEEMKKLLQTYSNDYRLSYFRNYDRYFVEIAFEV